jgi:hypothetical protein
MKLPKFALFLQGNHFYQKNQAYYEQSHSVDSAKKQKGDPIQ